MSAEVLRLFPEPASAPTPQGDFEAVWKAWPRKDGKAIARAKYDAIIRGNYASKTMDKSSGQFLELNLSATPEQIAAGVKAYVDSQIDRKTYRFKDDGKYVPHFATWLGRAGWQDFE